jgi:hypothetical protein
MARNPHLAQFYDDLRARYPVDGADMTYAEWISANTTLLNRPFAYKGFEFQQGIVNDLSRQLSVIKPSQVGMTEVQIRKFLAMLTRNRGTSGIFTFPNEKMFRSNSKTRIKPVVRQPVFDSTGLEEEKQTRSVALYEINGSWAHITGLTEGDATSTPADFLFHDELDLSDQAMIGLFQSRLQNSVHRITQEFSTPSHTGFGIDARYAASDQREYLTRCGGCGHWQSPTFDLKFAHLEGYSGDGKLDELDADTAAGIDFSSSFIKCERCNKPLDLSDPDCREWVARYPTRMAHGYRISPFSPTHGRLDLEYIVSQLLKMKQLDNLKGWYNTVLGLPFSDGNSKLDPWMVQAVMVSPAIPEVSGPVALGCDMGRTCHLTLGVIRQNGEVDPFLFEQVPSNQILERIQQLDRRYNIVTGGVDRHPYTTESERIRDATGRRVLPIEYRGASFMQLVKDEYDAMDHVKVNRTAAIDAQMKAIRNQATKMTGYGGLASVIVEHLCDMVRIEADEKPATWEKLTGADHFLHSLVLMRASLKARELTLLQNPVDVRSCVRISGGTVAPTLNLGHPVRGRNAQRII